MNYFSEKILTRKNEGASLLVMTIKKKGALENHESNHKELNGRFVN